MASPPAASQLTKVLAGLRHTFVVADATLPDMPLVFASEGSVHHVPLSGIALMMHIADSMQCLDTAQTKFLVTTGEAAHL